MGELVELDVTTVEESVTVNVTEEGQVQISVVAETGPAGPAGPAGPNSVTSATTSDGTANLDVTSISINNGETQLGSGGLNVGVGQYNANNFSFGLQLDKIATVSADNLTTTRSFAMPDSDGTIALTEDYTTGTATIDVLNATVQGTLTANHIHGNIAGSVYAHVRAGENLAKGDPVYISGFHPGSGYAEVSKADASNALKMPAVGIMDAAVSANANGHMVITGTISELDTNAYAVNSVLYVASGGGWTSTPPAANSQPVAIVERSNTNNGAVIVKVNGLASYGGNGVSDANKLARFSSTGGISQTGGTMTDTTYAGTASFTSTTRPTSAGTGTPAATSLITRADGDARFLLKPFVGILSTAVNSDTNTTTYKTVTELQTTLAAGTYQIEAFLIHDGNTNYLTSGVKDRINVISGSATAAGFVYRVFDNATTATTFPSGRVSTNPLVESAPTNRSQSTLRAGILTVTSTAVIAVQIAQTAAVAASNTTLQVGSYLKITQIS